MKQPAPHKYAAMISEWIKDTSRLVQVQLEDFGWMDQPNPNFDPDFNYRFADQSPVKPEIVSSLSDAELNDLTPMGKSTLMEIRRGVANAAAKRAVEDYKHQQELLAQIEAYQLAAKSEDIVSRLSDAELIVIFKNGWPLTREAIRAIANAAAKLAYAEGYQAAIDAVCAMSSESSLSNQKVTDLYNEIDDNTRARMCIANKAIAQFQADVKKLLGGV